MRLSENARNLVPLLRTVTPRGAPRLLYYAASNLAFRAAGVEGSAATTLQFRFGSFRIAPNCGDLGTIAEIFLHRPYTTLPEFVPQDGDVCIDVGANIGCVSIQWRATNHTGKIIAIEPHPSTFQRMVANFKLNRLPPIDCVQAAAGDRDAEADLLTSPHDSMAVVNGGCAGLQKKLPGVEHVRVRCFTIDRILAERKVSQVNLLKIDVEGYEGHCLRGCDRTLAATSKVVLEFHSEELKTYCTGFLESRGFTCEARGQILFGKKA